MLLVLGSALDDHPRRLVERWDRAGREVALVTPADLSCPGWRLRRGRPRETTASVSGHVVRGTDIDAVVCALPWVGSYDLPHVAEDDRDYVAQEMSSFLLAWLQELACPIIERPTTMSLAGLGRSSFEWAAMASSAGVGSDPRWAGQTIAVTVVGGCAVGEIPPAVADAAEAVASAASCSLVTLRFTDEDPPQLVTSDVRPEVGDAAAADALLAWIDQT